MIIESRFADPAFGVNALAERAGVSPAYLRELVYRDWQTHPNALIERQRVLEAIRFLRGHKLTVQEVSLAVGYSIPRRFRDAFQRHFRMTPGEYRRRTLAARARLTRRRAA
jgi:AraC-like DNA-binding protein